MSNQRESNVGVEHQVGVIVAEGQDVRGRISNVVTERADKMPTNRKGLIDLSRSVLDSATAALDKAVPHDRENILRQVIDGLGDGFSTAALATRLAIEEARSEEKRFAEEDMAQIKKDLQSVTDLFEESVSQAARGFRSMSQTEATSLRKHAEQTAKRVLPAIESALIAIEQHPLQFGRETVAASVQMARQTLGSLFSAIGRQMVHAGKRFAGERAD